MKNNNHEIDTQNRYKDLIAKCNYYSEMYYDKNESIISDAQFDALLITIKEIEKQNPGIISSDSPTQKVGGFVNKKFSKVKHKIPMTSLDNAFNVDDLIKFSTQMKKVLNNDKSIEFISEYKIDGLSISITYNNGLLQQAVTRGDGFTGEDVTKNIIMIKDIPRKIDYKKELIVRGEIYMPISVMNHLNNNGSKFANPRNAASGTLRQLDANVVKERKLESFIYLIPNQLDHGLRKQSDVLKFLEKHNFHINKNFQIHDDIHSVNNNIEKWVDNRKANDYEIDGIVIKINDATLYDEIGYTAKFPKFMIAYKFPEEIESTELTNIWATVGRTGRITYNAVLEPVRLAGSVVRAATLHNAAYIKELNINVGDVVNVKKSGEIIPKVLSVFHKNNNEPWVEISECPSCLKPLTKEEGVVDQYCDNQECPAIIQSKFEYFVSKKAFDIVGFSGKTIELFIKENMITNYPSIFKLSDLKDKILELPNWKIKSVNKLLRSIDKSKNIELERFINSLGIKHVGSKNSKTLANRLRSLKSVMDITYDEMIAMNDFGPKASSALVSYFSDETNKNQISEMLKNGVNIIEPKELDSNIFKNKTFVITGKLDNSRKHYVSIIENNAGNVSSSVSSKTSYLIVGESAGSKLDKAKNFKVTIIKESEFMKLLDKE